MEPKPCTCGNDPEIIDTPDIDECAIYCPKCKREVVRRQLKDCIKAWDYQIENSWVCEWGEK